MRNEFEEVIQRNSVNDCMHRKICSTSQVIREI